MDLGQKTACTASKSREMASASLSKRLNEAKEELVVALQEGESAEKILSLRNEIRDLPTRIEVAELTETRERLNEIEVELERNAENIRLFNEVLQERREEFEAKLDELAPFREAVDECALELS